MLVFDQLKKGDTHLRVLALLLCAGFGLLATGLWWVQVVRARDFQSTLETQSVRTVRVPAVRGKILDRNGTVLAENQPTYNISLYLEDLSPAFQKEYKRLRPKTSVTNNLPFWKRWLGSSAMAARPVKLTSEQDASLTWEARYRVLNDVLQRLGVTLQEPLALDRTNFQKHYANNRAMPYPVRKGVTSAQIARFEEQSVGGIPADLEIQSMRNYPHASTAGHLIGHLKFDDESAEGEFADFSYRLPDYSGAVGIETCCDKDLRGRAGVKSVIINNLGYRRAETIWSPAEAGKNVFLTLDLQIQEAAERAIRKQSPYLRGAAVVMEVESGDVVAMVSTPGYDPNIYVKGFPPGESLRLSDPTMRPQVNRATQMQYQPGSTFKPIIALALLETPEARFDPNEKYYVIPNPANSAKGIIYLGNQAWHDTVAPGPYDLRLALMRSSNTYFITNGLRRGVFDRVVDLGARLHLGERIGLSLAQEAGGHFPKAETARRWPAGYKANICIGQGEMDATPLQIAVMTCALANGGKVLQPRLVDRLESQDPADLEPPTVFPKGVVRDMLGVSPRSLDIVRNDMRDEVEDMSEGGTGHNARVPGLTICGKTGTAERTERGVKRNTVWFISYAPYERPKYAVVVAVEDGASGGTTCAPIAHDIYAEGILKSEATRHGNVLAQSN